MTGDADEFSVAIVGMAGRFPGANDIDGYWKNLCEGVESVRHFTDDELLEAGVPAALVADPDYVKAAPILDRPAHFDHRFFGYSATEAASMDPQHRLFLESSWRAIEHAGYDPSRVKGRVGVFGGSAANTYLLFSGIAPQFAAEYLPTLIGNDKDFLATRVAFKLGLSGPAMTVQTACSSSLVAVHLACQTLLNREADMMLAGGVAVRVPHIAGHHHVAGSVFSPDGRCRAFSAKANGTIFGSGVGVVALKRMADAVADQDTIWAVIRGSAVNNDGDSKADYTAPSVSSQADAITEALGAADVSARDISYVEAHGTGTYLGDPIEVAAMTRAFRTDTDDTGFCSIGSVKTNIGHLDAAAGVAGLIKVALSLHHGTIPASLHCEQTNPEIDFATTPFVVNTTLRDWVVDGPRIAGLSSLGIGGTNAHIIVQEAPDSVLRSGGGTSVAPQPLGAGRPELLVLSAPTAEALRDMELQLADYAAAGDAAPTLADAAFTLREGRKQFQYRAAFSARSWEQVAERLAISSAAGPMAGTADGAQPGVILLFSGQGSQHVGMAGELYQQLPSFREIADRCGSLFDRHLAESHVGLPTGLPLCKVIFGERSDAVSAALTATQYTQPALFLVEYAVGYLLLQQGVEPSALVGHSIGEFAAACLAGVMSLEDAAMIVAARGRLMAECPPGAMVSIALDEVAATELLGVHPALALAAVNSPRSCVLSGPFEAIEMLEAESTKRGVRARRLHTSHAFHSAMMNSALDGFSSVLDLAQLRGPQLPVISASTGRLLSAREATDPAFWVRQLRDPVRFADAIGTACSLADRHLLLEVGPGETLCLLAGQHPDAAGSSSTSTIPGAGTGDDAMLRYVDALGLLWAHGVDGISADIFPGVGDRLGRVALPGYAFQRSEHWFRADRALSDAPPLPIVGPPPDLASASSSSSLLRSRDAVELRATGRHGNVAIHWPVWVPIEGGSPAETDPDVSSPASWFVVDAGFEQADQFVAELVTAGHDVRSMSATCEADLRAPDAAELFVDDWRPERAVILLPCRPDAAIDTPGAALRIFAATAQLLHRELRGDRFDLAIVAPGSAMVDADDRAIPENASVVGPSIALAQELATARTRIIDPGTDPLPPAELARAVSHVWDEPLIALRNGACFVRQWTVRPPESADRQAAVDDSSVVLITGGLGTLGLQVASWALDRGASVALVSRTGLNGGASDVGIAAGTPTRSAQVAELRERGRVEVVTADVSNEEAMCGAFAQIAQALGPVTIVVHAAGALDDHALNMPILDLMADDIERHLRPKAQGVEVLHKVLADHPVETVVLFSSVSTVLGGFGYGPYAGANGWLDAAAAVHGDGWLSIAWDRWMSDEANGDGSADAVRPGMSGTGALACLGDLLDARTSGAVVVACSDLTERIDQWVRRIDVEETSSAVVLSPGTATIDVMADLWQRLLGEDRIGPRDNFFDLGGSSLLALKLFTAIERHFGIVFTLDALFEHPTPHALSVVIDRQLGMDGSGSAAKRRRPATSSHVITMMPKGHKTPLFILGAHEGSVIGLEQLARRMPRDRPLLGLDAPGYLPGDTPIDDMDELVEFHMASLRGARPDGPYLLGGYCFGGVVAIEMARRLTKAGDEVPLVVIMSSAPPGWTDADSNLTPPLSKRISTTANNLAHLDPSARHGYLQDGVSRVRRRVRGRVDSAVFGLADRFGYEMVPTMSSLVDAVMDAHLVAFNGFKSRPYGGDVLLLSPEHRPDDAPDDPMLGWGDVLTGDVTVHELAGGRFWGQFNRVVMPPVVDELVKKLSSHLESSA